MALAPFGLLLWLIFGGAAAREADAERQLAGTLMPGEAVAGQAPQARMSALTRRRLAIAISDSRIILIRRRLIGGFRMDDIQWKDLTDARIEQNVWPGLYGSNLAFAHADPGVPPLAVAGIGSDMAATIYPTAPFQKQAWEEKRRIRGMKETHVASGGVIVHAGTPAYAPAPVALPVPGSATAAASSGNRMLDQIAKAEELLDMIDRPVRKAAHVRHERVGVCRADDLDIAAQACAIGRLARRELRVEPARVGG